MKFNIKEYRLKNKLSLQQLSDITGFSKSYLCLLENNKREIPTDTLKTIARALKVCPKKILGTCKGIEDCNKCTYK